MNLLRLWFPKVCCATLCGIYFGSLVNVRASCAQETQPTSYANELPRILPTEPSEALKTMKVADGFELQLVAAEPLVRDPVAMAFDEQTRLFVVEMCDYSEQDTDFLGAIKLLEDADGDGRYEKSTVFADHLSWPTGVLCFRGGVFVAESPNIWYMKDIDGDGKSDSKQLVFTGFGRQNVQGLLNSLCWGIDNRVYCQTSSSGATLTTPAYPDRPAVNLNGRDFSFDPNTFELRMESGGGQHGMSFDDWGNRFTCSNSDHLQQHIFEDRFVGDRNVVMPASRVSIAVDGPQANVFRISPVEPWRTLRTQLRVTKQVPGVVEGGGRASGYFTSATGVTIYRGDAFPESMRGVAIVGDVGSNIIHRKLLKPNGIAMQGHRIDQDSELVASSDIWFRPVQFANAPDGTLYIADLYREVIEHPKSLPDVIKKHLDLTSGRDRGRIYRLAPKGFVQPSGRMVNADDPLKLLPLLHHPNGWHRDTASRLLYERLTDRNSSVAESIEILIGNLKELAKSAPLPKTRLHALGVLAACGAGGSGVESVVAAARERSGEASQIRKSTKGSPRDDLRHASDSTQFGIEGEAIRDPNAFVREFAIRCISQQPINPSAIVALSKDDSPRVRLQVALSWRNLDIEAVLQLLSTAGDDPYLLAATLNAIGKEAISTAILAVAPNSPLRAGEGRGADAPSKVWNMLGRLAAEQTIDSKLELMDNWLADLQDSPANTSLALGYIVALRQRALKGQGTEDPIKNLPRLNQKMHQLLADARRVSKLESASIEQRVQAIELLVSVAQLDLEQELPSLLHQREPLPVQLAAIKALKSMNSTKIADLVMDAWPTLSPTLRSQGSDLLVSRTSYQLRLLGRAGEGGFSLSQLDPGKMIQLQNSKEPAVRQAIETWLKTQQKSVTNNRSEVIERYRASLALQGSPAQGREVFTKSCASCHKLNELGHDVGPSIASYKFRGPEALMLNVLDPNREVNPANINYMIVTTDERIVTGMITNETATSVSVTRGLNQEETLLRSDIADMKSSNVSLMPEGLENQVSQQDMADLIAFIASTP